MISDLDATVVAQVSKRFGVEKTLRLPHSSSHLVEQEASSAVDIRKLLIGQALTRRA